MNNFIHFQEDWNKPLTKEFLIKQGQCCANNCTNCPYTKPRVKGNKDLEK